MSLPGGCHKSLDPTEAFKLRPPPNIYIHTNDIGFRPVSRAGVGYQPSVIAALAILYRPSHLEWAPFVRFLLFSVVLFRLSFSLSLFIFCVILCIYILLFIFIFVSLSLSLIFCIILFTFISSLVFHLFDCFFFIVLFAFLVFGCIAGDTYPIWMHTSFYAFTKRFMMSSGLGSKYLSLFWGTA